MKRSVASSSATTAKGVSAPPAPVDFPGEARGPLSDIIVEAGVFKGAGIDQAFRGPQQQRRALFGGEGAQPLLQPGAFPGAERRVLPAEQAGEQQVLERDRKEVHIGLGGGGAVLARPAAQQAVQHRCESAAEAGSPARATRAARARRRSRSRRPPARADTQ